MASCDDGAGNPLEQVFSKHSPPSGSCENPNQCLVCCNVCRVRLPLVVCPRYTGRCCGDHATRPSTPGSCHRSWHTRKTATPLLEGDSLACPLGHSEISPLGQRWRRCCWGQTCRH